MNNFAYYYSEDQDLIWFRVTIDDLRFQVSVEPSKEMHRMHALSLLPEATKKLNEQIRDGTARGEKLWAEVYKILVRLKE